MGRLVRATAGGLVLGMLVSLTVTSTPAYSEGDAAPAQVNLVLDISGSMNEPAGGGATKIDAARSAIRTAVGALPEAAEVGLRTFGGCGTSTQVQPVTKLDRGKITGAVDAAKPDGETPLAYALEQAGKDFTSKGPDRGVVLVSDGKETCGGDPVAAAKALAANCVDVHVDVIGFKVDTATAQELKQVAAAGCGEYLDASDGATLTTRLNRLALRAMRIPRAIGTPVTGTDSPESAPLIKPGQYRDVLPPGKGLKRWWAFDMPAGATVHATVTMPQMLPVGQSHYYDVVDMWIRDGNNGNNGGCELAKGNHIRSGGTSHHGGAHNVTAATTTALKSVGSCAKPGRWYIQTETAINSDRTRPVPIEITLRLTPKVANVEALPAPFVDNKEALPEPAVSGAPVTVDGSPSFTDAPILKSGVYADRVRAGEEIYYRVPLTWGQRIVARVRVPEAPAEVKSTIGTDWRTMWLLPYNPRRNQVDLYGSHINQSYSGKPMQLTAVTPPVRYRNPDTPIGNSTDSVRRTDTPGYYTLGVYFEADEADNLLDIPFELDLQIVGDRAGAPTYTDTPGATDPELEIAPDVKGNGTAGGNGRAAAKGGREVAGVPVAYVAAGGGGLLVLLLIGGLVSALWLRRRRTHPAAPRYRH